MSYHEALRGGPGKGGDTLPPVPLPLSLGGVLMLSPRNDRMRALLVGYLERGCNGFGEGEGKGASSSSASSSPQPGEGVSVASAFDAVAVAHRTNNKGEDDRGIMVADPPAIGGGEWGTTLTFKMTMATTTMVAKGLPGKKNGRMKGKKKTGKNKWQHQQELQEQSLLEALQGLKQERDKEELYTWCCDYCCVATFPTFQMSRMPETD